MATLRLISEDVQTSLTRWEPRIRLDNVTATLSPDDVRAVAADVLERPRCLSVVGPFREDSFALD